LQVLTRVKDKRNRNSSADSRIRRLCFEKK